VKVYSANAPSILVSFSYQPSNVYPALVVAFMVTLLLYALEPPPVTPPAASIFLSKARVCWFGSHIAVNVLGDAGIVYV